MRLGIRQNRHRHHARVRATRGRRRSGQQHDACDVVNPGVLERVAHVARRRRDEVRVRPEIPLVLNACCHLVELQLLILANGRRSVQVQRRYRRRRYFNRPVSRVPSAQTAVHQHDRVFPDPRKRQLVRPRRRPWRPVRHLLHAIAIQVAEIPQLKPLGVVPLLVTIPLRGIRHCRRHVRVAKHRILHVNGCIVNVPNQDRVEFRRAGPALQGVAVILSRQDDAGFAVDGALEEGVGNGLACIFSAIDQIFRPIPKVPHELRRRAHIR